MRQVRQLTLLPFTTLDDLLTHTPSYLYYAIIGSNDDVIERCHPENDTIHGLRGAFASNNTKWIAYFRDRGVPVTSVHILNAIVYGHLNLVQQYLPAIGYDPRMIEEAVEHRCGDIVRYLVTEYRHRIDFRSAISLAVTKYDWDIFEYLIDFATEADLPKYDDTCDFREVNEYLELRRSNNKP